VSGFPTSVDWLFDVLPGIAPSSFLLGNLPHRARADTILHHQSQKNVEAGDATDQEKAGVLKGLRCLQAIGHRQR
jgi:hypothetical protein